MIIPEMTTENNVFTGDGVECPIVNTTELRNLLIDYCSSDEWAGLKSGNGFPDTSNRTNATFENVFIFCEHVNTPLFNLMTLLMQISTFVAIILLMMGLGVTMEPSKILEYAKRPVGATIATVVQFGVMPFVSYGLAYAFEMDEIKTLTMVVLGCCPGGTLSNFMALLLRGDMNLSILMTSVSTLVGVVAIPMMIKLLSGFFLDPCTDLVVDTASIVKPLIMTLVPCGIGMAVRKWSTVKVCDVILQIGKVGMVAGLGAIIITNVIIYRSSLIIRFPIDIIIAISLIPVAGFVIGFIGAWCARENYQAQRTIMLETGLKNAQICLAIMLVTFPSEKVGVLMMVPIYLVAFQIVESAVLALLIAMVLKPEEPQDVDDYDDEMKDQFASFNRRQSLDFANRFGSQPRRFSVDKIGPNTVRRLSLVTGRRSSTMASTMAGTEDPLINNSSAAHKRHSIAS